MTKNRIMGLVKSCGGVFGATVVLTWLQRNQRLARQARPRDVRGSQKPQELERRLELRVALASSGFGHFVREAEARSCGKG